jgi:hypothetical protein
MQYKIDCDGEFLLVRMWGRKTDQPPSEVCAAILEGSRRLERERILIELDQEIPLSATSQFALVSRLPRIGFTPRHRIALVHSTREMHEANQFINLIAENRGIMVRNFQGREVAKDWLREEAGGAGA